MTKTVWILLTLPALCLGAPTTKPDKPVCTQKEYDQLKERIGLAEVAAKASTVMLLSAFYQDPKPANLTQRELCERRLVDQGIPREQLKQYVKAMTAVAPHCLGGISLEFIRLHRRDVLMERGQYFLEVLRDHVVSTGRRPDTIEDLPLVEDHPVFGEHADPYGHAYRVDYTPFRVALKSLGPDAKPSDDDIVIGDLDISR